MIIAKQLRLLIASAACVSMLMYGCTDKWDDRTELTDPNLRGNIYTHIAADPDLTEFSKLLQKGGFDKVLASSKTYTVWAPDNAAMANIDPEIVNDTAALRNFLENHISLSAFSTGANTDTITVRTLNGKRHYFIGSRIADVNLKKSNVYAANGLIHIVDKALLPKKNIWEFITSEESGSTQQAAFLSALSEIGIFPQDSLYTNTDDPLQDNEFLRNVYNLSNENKKFTYFLISDEGLTSEMNKLLPYFNLPSADLDSSQNLAKYYVLRDMAFEGVYTPNQLPNMLVSKFGVQVPIDKDNLSEPIQLSNGIVYKVNSIAVPLTNRLVTTIVEGEEPYAFSQADKRNNTFYRERKDPAGSYFQDIMIQNHGIAQFKIFYRPVNMYSTTYKVYWRAVNDIQTNVFQQRLNMGITANSPAFPYTNVELKNYDEVYLGEYTLASFGNLYMSLVAANTASNGANTLTLDYIKLVPQVK